MADEQENLWTQAWKRHLQGMMRELSVQEHNDIYAAFLAGWNAAFAAKDGSDGK